MSEKERQIKNEAIRLIARLYKDLYLSEDVIHHGIGNKYDKLNNITSYLDKLESVHNRISETNRHIEYLKQGYYDRYVIKREDIPMSYYRHQQEIALERGLGHIELTKEKRREIQDELIQNQKASIDTWLNYFLSKDAEVYPFWAKYWAFQGMLKLGVYDKEKGVFHKRTKETVESFADLNREALAMSIDLVTKMLDKKIEDKKPKSEEEEKRELSELEILVRNGSFPKIYSYVLRNLLRNNKNIIKRNTGIWVKYNQGSNHMPLVESLQGYNTGWCTAGVSTAEMQLRNGDFYVYYSLDENDEYKVPRIAIRMEGNNIAEIRGIAKDQNLEPEMEEVVEEKIKDFPDKEEYYKKVNDMKELTKINKKHKNNLKLTKEELRFIYEIDSKIKGFGYEKDPRIEEIISERNSERKDLAIAFDCTEAEVALKEDEINSNTVYYKGSLDLSSLASAEGLVFPKSVGGDLDLSGLTSAEGLVLPNNIGGSLYLSNLTSIEGLVLPNNIGGSLDLISLTNAKDLTFPKHIGNNLYLDSLIDAEGLVLPKSIGWDLDLSDLTIAEGLVFPNSIGGNLHLNSLTNAKDLTLPKHIGNNLYLDSLIDAEGLVLPKSIGWDLDLSGLTSAEGLVLPSNIGGTLYLGGLTSAKGLVLPNILGGGLDLSGLTSTEGLVLPEHVGDDIYLSSLETTEGLIFPDNLTYNIHLKYFDITPENVEEYRITKKL